MTIDRLAIDGALPITLLIKNGTIVTATDHDLGDVLIAGEKLTTIGTTLTMPTDRVIDATFGGTTTIVDFAIQSRGERLHDAFEAWSKKAQGKAGAGAFLKRSAHSIWWGQTLTARPPPCR